MEEHKAQKDNRVIQGRQITHMLYQHFRITGTNESVLEVSDFVSFILRGEDVQGFDTKRDGVLLSMTETSKDDILENMYRQKLRNSEQLKTTFAPVQSRMDQQATHA